MSRDRFPHTPAALRDIVLAPGNGYPRNPGQDRAGMSPWGRLCAGQAMGKSTTLYYQIGVDKVQQGATPMLRIEGDDMDACQMVITLAEPRVIPQALTDLPINFESAPSGGVANNGVSEDDFPGTPDPLAWPPLEAVVAWGVGGMQAEAVIDYVNGVTFSIVASFVNVKAQVSQSHLNGDIVGSPAAYLVGAFAGPGVCFSPNAQRTIYVDSVADGAESAVFEVPRFARRATVVGADPAVNTVTAATISFYQGRTGDPTTNVGNFFQSGNQPIGFPVPNAGQYFNVKNTSGTGMRLAVIFELALS